MKKEFYPNIPKIEYEGPKSKNMLAFKHYNKDEVVMGKKMSEHFKFAFAYWHGMNYDGTDMFGGGTYDRTYGESDGKARMKAKADAAFELMQKLGFDYFCFHDVDLCQPSPTLRELKDTLVYITDYIQEHMERTGIKLGWGTANMFSDSRYKHGAATSPYFDTYASAACQVKNALDATIKLGGTGYTFWGGREGYETLLNTDMAFELDNLARFYRMAIDYGRANGFKGTFFIEPKPKEPTMHQYDFDAATAIGFIQKYGFEDDFKLNLEANHASLAGHTFEHEIRVARINGMLGSLDVNHAETLVGWDTDEFPKDVRSVALTMYEMLKSGGLTDGVINFDAKLRRPSSDELDNAIGFIVGMDTFALGLKLAAKMIEDGRIDKFVEERYSSYNQGLGAKVLAGETNLEELEKHALELENKELPSGRQEYLNGVINDLMCEGL
ncbi:MAG: xylose isomerase [Bacillota bacterium]|jgi:xylose isomerase|nr:xylose isomerase [Bacillota bacterium]